MRQNITTMWCLKMYSVTVKRSIVRILITVIHFSEESRTMETLGGLYEKFKTDQNIINNYEFICYIFNQNIILCIYSIKMC